jgi:uncharacterized protein YdaU (DUF1376 family)
MHYYQFNIGDYASHTRHLSPIEDIAYRRLLDLYYLHERPLNSGLTSVARQINLREYESEVKSVLEEFFTLMDDGWINVRADKEIAHFRGKIEQASRAGRASAERRSNARSTDVQPTNNHKPITNNQIKERNPIVPAELPDWLNKTDWNDFVEMRKKLKKPMTDRAVKLMLSKLETMKNKGINTSEVLQKSILANWSDVYEPKVQTQQNSMGRRVL